MEKMKLRNVIKYLFLTGLLILVSYVFILYQYHAIDFGGTISTQYHEIENSTDQIIETDYFELRTPENWIHIFSGHGVEGTPYGSFQTSKGVIHYEYGIFVPDYSEDDKIYGYKVEQRNINLFKINIARNTKGEIGICIPRQNEMEFALVFYLDKSVTNNFDEIISGIKELKFK
jgi:hypothetical protein